MRVKELLKEMKGKYTVVEFYEFTDRRKSFHTDRCKYINDWEINENMLVDDYSLMDLEEISNTLLANCSQYAGEMYEADDILLAIAVKEESYNQQDVYDIVEGDTSKWYFIEEFKDEENEVMSIIEYQEELKIYFISVGDYGEGWTDCEPVAWTRNKKDAVRYAKQFYKREPHLNWDDDIERI